MGTFLLVNICSASRDTGKFFLCPLFFLLLSNLTLQAQTEQEWEIVDDSKLAWTPSSNLSVYNNTLKDLSVANLIAEDKETKKNNSWHAEYVTLGISWEETRPYEISFTIRNNNNRPDYKYKVYREKKGKLKEEWHKGSIYWGFQIQVNDKFSGKRSYTQCYSNRKNYNNAYTYTDSYNSISNIWQNALDLDEREVRIVYDGNSTISVYSGLQKEPVVTFEGAKSVAAIYIMAGSAAYLRVTNFHIKRKTLYGIVKPKIQQANTALTNERYNDVVRILSEVIDSHQYKSFDVYYMRAYAHAQQEHYQSAIKDCDFALSYKPNDENSYLIRGLCKLAISDESGISDLRQAGGSGMHVLEEYGLNDYNTSGQTPANTFQNNTVKQAPAKKKILKKDPNFKLE